MNSFIITAVILFMIGVVTAQMQLEPQFAPVLLNSNASFNCSVNQPGWISMTWLVNGRSELIILEDTGAGISSPNFMAKNFSSGGISQWMFTIINVTRTKSNQTVSCLVQGNDPLIAILSVQESGTVAITGANRTVMEGVEVVFDCFAVGWFPEPQISWTMNGQLVDMQFVNTSHMEVGGLVNSNSTVRITARNNATVECLASVPALTTPQSSRVLLIVERAQITPVVLIAIIVACVAAVLLTIIVIALVLYCNKKKKANRRYQEEGSGRGQGQDNLGYITDRHTADDSNSEISDDGSQQSSSISTIQVPHMVDNYQEINGAVYVSYTGDNNGVKKHRHATLV